MVTAFLVRSPWGRVVKAIREDENAVRSLGKNVYAFKMQSLMVGGVIGALAGILFALARQSVAPDSLATVFTFSLYVILVMGGAARVAGPIIGAILFFFLYGFVDVALRQAIGAGHIDFLVANEVGIVRQMLVGVGLMALMVFRPQGIIGDKREVAVSVRR
jgi:branched-chain amino acid transport system permease protein